MQKDASYHEAAIQYNQELADFASDLSKRLEHEEVSRWSRAVSKQHQFHAGRHEMALRKLKSREQGATENTEDGGEGRALDVDHVSETPKVTCILSDPFKIEAARDVSQDASPIHNQGEVN